MADPVAQVVAAPKKAFKFASENLLAFAVVAIVVVIAIVAYQVRNPGKVEEKIGKIPGVGPWALNRAA